MHLGILMPQNARSRSLFGSKVNSILYLAYICGGYRNLSTHFKVSKRWMIHILTVWCRWWRRTFSFTSFKHLVYKNHHLDNNVYLLLKDNLLIKPLNLFHCWPCTLRHLFLPWKHWCHVCTSVRTPVIILTHNKTCFQLKYSQVYSLLGKSLLSISCMSVLCWTCPFTFIICVFLYLFKNETAKEIIYLTA